MRTALSWVLALLLGAGCAGRGAEPVRTARTAPPEAPAGDTPAPSAEPGDAASALAHADRLYTEQLGAAGRDDRYVDRQVTALREAIALYEQFIAHAGEAEQYRDAVRRSRERIEDARATIEFLLAGEPSAR